MTKKEKQIVCPVCDAKLSFFKAVKIKDGIKICEKHYEEAGIKISERLDRAKAPFTVEELRERIKSHKKMKEEHQKEIDIAAEEFKKEVDNFVITKQMGNFVAFDDEQKKWATLSSILGNIEQIYSYSDIVDFELLEDGESVAKGGLGRALVGGLLFGGTGAIVGGVTGKRKTTGVCSSLKLKVTVNNLTDPVVYINFINTKTKKNSSTYQVIAELAQECLSVFQLICEKQKDEKKASSRSSLSLADEIKQFKELLDEGIITKEDFDRKKNELLGL